MAALRLVLLQIILFLICPIKGTQFVCENTCGNVTISFPFGIGKGCYFNESFEVICDRSSRKAKLKSIDLELAGDIYFASDPLMVNIPSISLKNSGNITTTSTSRRFDLSDSPFSFADTYNRLAAIGCNKYALFNQQSNSTDSGCLTILTCDPSQASGCYDFICEIPPDPMSYKSHLSYIFSKTKIPQECRSAFMVDQQWLESNYLANPDVLKNKEYAPAMLQWGKGKGRCAELFTYNSTFCNDDDYCLIQMSSGDFCVCDNRRSERFKGCTGDLICNSKSGYNCSQCPDGYKAARYYYSRVIYHANQAVYQVNQTRCTTPRGYNDILIRKSRAEFFIIIGCSSGLGVLLLLLGVWWLYKFIKRRKKIKRKQKFFKRNGGLLLQQHISANEGDIRKTKLFTSKELEIATDNYNANRILGQGGQGTVYKGMLAEGKIVAVKKSKIVDESKLEEFINELVILSQINHRNVVQLLGCCLETEVPLLVYEFIPNGTLFQHIHDQNEEFPITWELRLRIATEIAGALSYLHSTASIPIYHRDIKSTNILLDEKYRAKISDFGTSRSVTIDQTHLTTQVQGTFGYVDPEYFQSSQFTEKSDVYSFGVVLVELLTGQKPIRSIKSEEDRSLATYFLHAIEKNHLFEVLDARVLKGGTKEDIITVASLARRCLNLSGKKRPTMREVANELAGVRKSNEASIMLKSHEEIDIVDGGITSHFETGSSFIGSFFDSATFSADIDPLISNTQ